jgi:BirA family biotin operon repressor/biotin-[acetyl-CoA-carboxylase] ligase
VRRVEETESTNADLVALADTADDGSVLVTGHQTAGRGRMDRRWDAPPDVNLLMSVLLRPTGGSDRRSLVTSTLAVAVVDVLTDLFGGQGPTVCIKWPNDVLLVEGDRPGKVAGILAELVDGDPPAVIVGVGLNVGWPGPHDEGPPGATSLAAAGVDSEPRLLLDPVLSSFGYWLGVLEAPEGVEAIRLQHLERSATIGQLVRIESPSGMVEGLAVDLAADGALIVEVDGGRREFRAGDVVHLRPLGPG